jgi:CHAD domain-containing protein
MSEFTAAVLDSCLDQVMGNVSELAAGSQGDEHVHQARVGIRRLRTALREFPTLAGDSERFEPVLVEVFRALGQRRDRTHVLRDIQPLVEAAGGRPLRVPPEFHEGPDPGKLVRSDDFQDALLSLLARAEQARTSTPGSGVRKTMRGRMTELSKQVTREGRRFTDLAEERQHRVRKRLKRLRYLCEFIAPLYPKDAVHVYLAEIKPAQDALGHYYDQIMAQSLFEELMSSDPGARFGVEWLQARRPAEAKACRRSLRTLESANGFWKK